MSVMGSPEGRAKFFQNLNRSSNQDYSRHRTQHEPHYAPRQGGGMPASDFNFGKAVIRAGRSQAAKQNGSGNATVDTDQSLLREEELKQDRLPVELYKDQYLRALKHSDIVIITAETGAGKSTLIPQFTREAGYKVTVTQPRRLAASSLATFVADQQDTSLGEGVGFRHALEQLATRDSGIVFETDGYRFASENNRATRPEEVLILDEVHEFNKHMEAILALMQLRRDRGEPVPKIVIMSATMNAAAIDTFFGGGNPIISVPGRTFPVEELAPGDSIQADVATSVRAGKNMLVFLPGKGEIAEMEGLILQELASEGLDAEIIPLHSKLSRAEQERAFRSYDVPKVVLATDVAQTSLTIPDVDGVILSGLVRRIQIEDGVEVLSINDISQFDYIQQKGRAGRTKDGFCINHGQQFDALAPESPPEIQSTKLEGLFLRLLAGGEVNSKEEIERMKFVHQPPQWLINDTFKSLRELGLVGTHGITEQGRRVAALPVDVRTAKMLLRAEELSHGDRELKLPRDPELLLHAIDVAAVMEADGVVASKKKNKWKDLCKGEYESDVFAQVKVFHRALEMQPDRYHKFGIDPTSLVRAADLRSMLRKRLGVTVSAEAEGTPEMTTSQRTALRYSIAAGMIDSVFTLSGRDDRGKAQYTHLQHRDSAYLSHDSVIEGSRAVVGKRFNIVSWLESGDVRETPLLLMATEVTMDMIKRARAHIVRPREEKERTAQKLEKLSSLDRSRGRRGSKGFRNDQRGNHRH